MQVIKGLILAAAVFSGAVFGAQDVTYIEGVHYEKRAEQKSPSAEIREFFSFWCNHCFSMQGTFSRIEEHFKGTAQFIRNPVDAMGGAMGAESQKALAAASLIGIETEFAEELFNQMHKEGKIPQSRGDFAYLFESLGIPADKYNRDVSSFPVQGIVASWNKAADDLKIDAVPELVVNGKYVVSMGSVKSGDELIDLVAYVLTLD